MDSAQANPDFSGNGLYRRAWFRVNGMTLRVASFNVASGALITQSSTPTGVPSGSQYETWEILSPEDLDRCLDWTVRRMRDRREVAIPTVDGDTTYALDGAASPNYVAEVMGGYYFAAPDGTLGRDRRPLTNVVPVTTASGTREARISPALGQSQQLVLDCILVLSLPAADAATINIPDEEWLLAGAAAKAFDLLIQRSPGQEADTYKERRLEHAREFTRLSGRYQPEVERMANTWLDSAF